MREREGDWAILGKPPRERGHLYMSHTDFRHRLGAPCARRVHARALQALEKKKKKKKKKKRGREREGLCFPVIRTLLGSSIIGSFWTCT